MDTTSPRQPVIRAARLLAVSAVGGLLATGCGAATGSSTSSAPGRASTTTSSGPIVLTAPSSSGSSANSQRQGHVPLTEVSAPSVAHEFARAYASYLDGRLAVADLPDVTPAARMQVGPAIPVPDRAGSLTVGSTRQTTSGPSTFLVVLQNRTRQLPAQVSVARVGSRWLVVGVTPPDLDSMLARPTRPNPQPAGSAAAEQAARRFLAGYLEMLYGRGRGSRVGDATPALAARLKANPPRVPPTFQRLRFRVLAVGMQRHGAGWQAYGSITDGRERFDALLSIERVHGKWLVGAVEQSS